MKKGVVVSDMHLFARRSEAHVIEKELYFCLSECNLLILNGDTVDFRWTMLPSLQETIDASVCWIQKITDTFPSLDVIYIIGNHDCTLEYVSRLRHFEKECPQFSLYEYYLQLGKSIFLHGDCANALFTFDQFKKYRTKWAKTEQWPDSLALGYQLCDAIGLTELVHKRIFPTEQVAHRIIHYLQTIPDGFPSNLKNIYFGHTHLPLSNFKWRNYVFHNSGSAIKGQKSNILNFTINESFIARGL